MNSMKFSSKPSLQALKSSKFSVLSTQQRTPDSTKLMKLKQTCLLYSQSPKFKTGRTKTFNFSETDLKPVAKMDNLKEKIEKSIILLQKTKGQKDLSTQLKVEEMVIEIMKLCQIDNKILKLLEQIKEEKEQKQQSQFKTMLFINRQQNQIEQLKRRCSEYN
ncbi:unnamed protein product (macronuclear) [Paramecium tetraurelia]|uniref:Uncharacterized protein n=1 Tax=Paramecium tetraurelia TaxID=5888 RepID=A0DDC8_PARTE|nr:uncharacterized protein GSPATT00015904001 [Paramecium tetraurelia]CAK81045.1 unnamed protein product [Paramecium tetraurelia]|eukprot:XP_001448442.1 hypothetical protein (macronuclear) [Paramecium tetraurelia strain d4-2]